MPIVSKVVLKTYFEDGKEPNEDKYIDFIDTMGLADHGSQSGLGDDDHPQYLLADGSRIVSGGFAIGAAHPQTLRYGHLFIHDGSVNDYGFIESEAEIFLSANCYFDGSVWKAIKTGKTGVIYVSPTTGLVFRADNTSRAAGATTTHAAKFGVDLDGDAYITGGLYIGSSSPVTTAGRLKMTENLYLGGGIVLGNTGGAIDDDHITFYQGGTRVGEIGSNDTSWLRINQTTNKNIYTPRAIRADGGLSAYSSGGLAAGQVSAGPNGLVVYYGGAAVGQITTQDTTWNRICQTTAKNTYTPQYFYGAAGLRAGSAAAAPSGGDITFADRIKKDHQGTDYSGNIYVPVTPDIPGTSWWGTAKSTGGTWITISTTFPGIPSNVRAVVIRMMCRDSVTHPSTVGYLIIGPDSTTNDNMGVRAHGNNMINENTGICNVSNNTIYAYRVASGGSTLDCWLTVIGYYI